MLKRLLSRDISSKVAFRAKKSVTSDEADGVSLPETEGLTTPAPTPQTPTPELKTPDPSLRRRSTSMRASDVIDEHGRSAEQLAAEAALEFDIMAVARRVNEEGEAGGGATVTTLNPGPVARPKVEAGPRHAHSDLSASTTPSEAETPASDPSPAPAAATVTPLVAKPSAAALPSVALHAPKSVPAGIEIENGHIFHPGADHGAAEKTLIARNAYWNQVGRTAPEPLSYPVSPETKGVPAWPTSEQRFRLVRTASSLIIATEGLSDPFGAFRGPSDVNGFGMELFIEVPGMQATSPEAVRAGWAFKALEHAAILCAHAKGLAELLEAHGVMSLDLGRDCVPNGWIVPGHAEPAGALLDMPMPPGRDTIKGMPLSRVRAVPLTLIFPEELEDCLVSGADERRALVNDLLTTGQGHKSDPKRSSLR